MKIHIKTILDKRNRGVGMYEYPQVGKYEEMLIELETAILHDSLLHSCYKHFQSTRKNISNPFGYYDFFVYLSYMALSANQKHMKMCVQHVNLSVNPPIVLQQGDKYYPKGYIDGLHGKTKRSYWRKLIDATLGK